MTDFPVQSDHVIVAFLNSKPIKICSEVKKDELLKIWFKTVCKSNNNNLT